MRLCNDLEIVKMVHLTIKAGILNMEKIIGKLVHMYITLVTTDKALSPFPLVHFPQSVW